MDIFAPVSWDGWDNLQMIFRLFIEYAKVNKQNGQKVLLQALACRSSLLLSVW